LAFSPTDVCDYIIVGSGIAGLRAAIEAKRAGADGHFLASNQPVVMAIKEPAPAQLAAKDRALHICLRWLRLQALSHDAPHDMRGIGFGVLAPGLDVPVTLPGDPHPISS